jgi:anti-sigma B factor antagonist
MQTLTTTCREAGSVTIVDLSGRIDLGGGSALLRDTIRSLVAKDRIKIALNMSGVSYIDSAGVGELVGAYLPIKSKGGGLVLLNPSGRVLDVLKLTQLTRIFKVYESEPAALESLA